MADSGFKTEAILEAKSGWEKMENETVKRVEQLITDISKEFKAHETEIGQELAKGLEGLRQAQNEANTLMPCPTCKKGNLRIIYSKKTRRQTKNLVAPSCPKGRVADDCTICSCNCSGNEISDSR